MSKRISLGKNLSALLGPTNQDIGQQSIQKIDLVPIENLKPGNYQPRIEFNIETLQELSISIKQQGVLQPIIVRKLVDNQYEILAGERRWRAAKIAGLSTVPVITNTVDNKTAMAIGLVENLQRDDLNSHEQAIAIQKLIEEFALTHQQIADLLGKSRSTISNLLRLLQLPKSIQHLLAKQELEMGHARAILCLDEIDQQEIAKKIVKNKLSVRQTEQLVNNILNPKIKSEIINNAQYLAEINKINKKFNSNIKIKHNNKGHSQITMSFKNNDSLRNILNYLSVDKE